LKSVLPSASGFEVVYWLLANKQSRWSDLKRQTKRTARGLSKILYKLQRLQIVRKLPDGRYDLNPAWVRENKSIVELMASIASQEHYFTRWMDANGKGTPEAFRFLAASEKGPSVDEAEGKIIWSYMSKNLGFFDLSRAWLMFLELAKWRARNPEINLGDYVTQKKLEPVLVIHALRDITKQRFSKGLERLIDTVLIDPMAAEMIASIDIGALVSAASLLNLTEKEFRQEVERQVALREKGFEGLSQAQKDEIIKRESEEFWKERESKKSFEHTLSPKIQEGLNSLFAQSSKSEKKEEAHYR
jgi:hypothetical protein